MNEPKTPNLGLNKIDRSSPSTTYFDLDKYLDQNWEKVDEGVGQVEEKAEETAAQVSSIQERLDTEKRRSVTLEPGLQVINAERASAFKLEGLKGRTLVNLLGRDGGCERIGAFSSYQATLSADTSKKAQGSQSLKITTTATPSGLSTSTVFTLKAGSYYLIAADVKLVSGTSLGVYLNGITSTKGNVNSIDSTKFNTVWKAYSVSATETSYAVGEVVGPVGSNGNVDALRVYEISSEDYVALDNMTTEQVNAKYPYVDSVQPVRSPYAIRIGENLLPPFYDWTPTGNAKIASGYEVTISSSLTENVSALSYDVLAIPNADYTLSLDLNGSTMSVTGGEDGTLIVDNTSATSVTFNSGNRTMFRVFVTNYTAGLGTTGVGNFVFKNPMLVHGKVIKPFKPRTDAVLALQTDLYADQSTGANADEVFEKDGQYFKLAKWKNTILDGNHSWSIYQSPTGVKYVRILSFSPDSAPRVPWCVKYNGKVLSQAPLQPDSCWIDTVNKISYVGVPNTDSGWGDSYTPTADEIKAYFMGWRMYDGGQTGNLYNGTGVKTWNSIKHWGTPTYYTTTLPTAQAPEWTPYQLLYQLATPTVEPITSEGQLTFVEGDNQIEVGTGLVVRERANPKSDSVGAFINVDSAIPYTSAYTGSELRYRTAAILAVYKNGQRDSWLTETVSNAYGRQRAFRAKTDYDPSAAYSVTYLMLDKYPIASFVGSVAENEKALLTDNVNAIHDVNFRLDVLEDFFGNIASEEVINGASKTSIAFSEDIAKGSMVSIIESLKELYSIYTYSENLAYPDMVIHPDVNRVALYNRNSDNGVRVYSITPGGSFVRLYSGGIGSDPLTSISLYGDYMVISFPGNPYVYIWKWDGTTYIRLASTPSIAPSGPVSNTAFSPDGKFLIVGSIASPYWIIYKRTGDSFVKLPNVTGVPSVVSLKDPRFTPDGKYLFVANNTTPHGVFVFKISGDTFTKLPIFITSSSGQGDIIFTKDSKYVIFSYLGSTGPTVYRINSDDTFTGITVTYKNGVTFWGGSVRNADISPDGKIIFFTFYSGIVRRIDISGDSFVATLPDIPIKGAMYDVRFSPDGIYLLVTCNVGGSVYIVSYEWNVFEGKVAALRSITDITPGTTTGIGYTLEDGKKDETKQIMRLV